MRHFSRRESGQAAVETAIVMPLFVFIILGILQLGLVHQARIMTKYAAYKAVRAGALRGADKQVMTNAAIAALLPILTNGQDNGGKQPIFKVYNVTSGSDYSNAYGTAKNNSPPWGKLVDVNICAPTGSKAAGDFDHPETNGHAQDWEGAEKTKLAVQVTTYMPLYIPYANAFVWWAARGEDAQVAQTMNTLRMSTGKANDFMRNRHSAGRANAKSIVDFEGDAANGTYILPIRASYAMRMQSQFADGVQLPSSRQNTDCLVAWPKQ